MTTPESTANKATNSSKFAKIAFIIALCVAAVVIYFVQSRDLSVAGWSNNPTQTLAKAKKENRKVCLMFVNSPPSQIDKDQRREVTTKSSVKIFNDLKYLGCVVHNNSANQALAKKFGVKSRPTLVTLNPDGTLRNKHEGYLSQVPFRQKLLVDTLSKKPAK